MNFSTIVKKIFTAFKKALIENKIFFDVLMKVIATFATILLAFQGNQILKQQNMINELEIERNALEVAPSFLFSKKKNNQNISYEMTNNKGFISNVVFGKIDRITFYSNYQENEPSLAIIDFYSGGLKEENSEKWITRGGEPDKLRDFADNIVKKINSSFDNERFYYSLDSYYRVIYNDFQNIRHEEYYEVDFDGSGLYTTRYLNVEDIHEMNGVYLWNTQSKASITMTEKELDRIVDTAVNELTRYYNIVN